MSRPKRYKNLIDRTQIPIDVQKIVHQLLDQDFDAKLVGGCVRDLLLEISPKDFDIVTSAKPDQVATLFRSARLIGRRFRIVHVQTSIGIVEISTYRRFTKAAAIADHRRKDREALNKYGKIRDDYRLRDFTINALYYDLSKDEVLDFTNGMQDIKTRTLRTIGNPQHRFEEDCHRVLRAIRFESKLPVTLEPQLAKVIKKSKPLLRNLERSRLRDDLRKLLLSGHGRESFKNLAIHRIRSLLFPYSSDQDALTIAALENTDRRVQRDEPVRLEFLLAAMYWKRFFEYKTTNNVEPNSLEENWHITRQVLANTSNVFKITNVMIEFVNGTWFLQSRLEENPPKKIMDTLARKRFRAAYDLLALRVECGEVAQSIVDWWTKIQNLEPTEQQQLIATLEPKKRKRRRRKKKQDSQPPSSNEAIRLTIGTS